MTLMHSIARRPAARSCSLSVVVLAVLIEIAASHLSGGAFGQELKAGQTPGTVTTQPLGISGWRSDPVVVTSQQLGMTGWRSDPIAVATQPLGMTGWRSDPIAAATPPLGMTGWRSESILLTAQPLGMTGWRREPDTAPPARLVCLGGRVVSLAAGPGAPRYSCACPAGRTAQAVGANYENTFQCIPDTVVVPPPQKIACIGGTVQGGRCTCAAGKTAKLARYAISGNAPAWRCEDSAPVRVADPPKIVCTGGSVRNNACVCQPGFAPVKTGATSFRCQRVAILPPVTVPKAVAPTRTLAPTVACAGGVVRSNRCVCPSGTSLQSGVCRASNAPVRSGATQLRVR